MKCVICGNETTLELLNETYDILEPVCYDCEEYFWKNSSIQINSEIQPEEN